MEGGQIQARKRLTRSSPSSQNILKFYVKFYGNLSSFISNHMS